MPFHRNRNITKRDKHEITWSNLAADASTAVQILLSTGVATSAKNLSTECVIGAHIRAIYLEFHFSAETVTSPKVIHWTVEGLLSGQTGTTPSTYYQAQRASIIKRGMEMIPKDVSTVYKRQVLVLIPKKFQRVTDGGGLVFRYICTSAETVNACGIAIYKEMY